MKESIKFSKSECFEITAKDADQLSVLRWVMLAICKDQARRNLCVVNVKAQVFACTDGMRLHCATLPEINIPDGNYLPIINYPRRILLQKADEGILFLDLMKIYPGEKNPLLDSKKQFDFVRAVVPRDHAGLAEAVWHFNKVLRESVQIRFIADACLLGWDNARYVDNDHMITIGDEKRFVTIMGMRV